MLSKLKKKTKFVLYAHVRVHYKTFKTNDCTVNLYLSVLSRLDRTSPASLWQIYPDRPSRLIACNWSVEEMSGDHQYTSYINRLVIAPHNIYNFYFVIVMIFNIKVIVL